MIVCSCNVLSDTAIKEAYALAETAPRTPGQVYRCLGCSAQCGRCARTIRALLDQARGTTPCSGCDDSSMTEVEAMAPALADISAS